MAKKKEKWQKREQKLSGEKEEKEEKVGSRIRRNFWRINKVCIAYHDQKIFQT